MLQLLLRQRAFEDEDVRAARVGEADAPELQVALERVAVHLLPLGARLVDRRLAVDDRKGVVGRLLPREERVEAGGGLADLEAGDDD